jgi:RNA polymerase sigma factor (sigma-70 family)
MVFPDTRHSAIDGIRAGDDAIRRQSLNSITAAYWQPVRAYLRARWRENDDGASDLTQAFFAKLLQSSLIQGYDPQKGPFRTYLRACIDNFVRNARKQNKHERTVLLDFDIPATLEPPDEVFHREWVRRLFWLAIEDLRARRDGVRFQVFEKYDLSEAGARPTYLQLAGEFGVTPETITNYLAAMRRDFRAAVLMRLRDLTATEREFRSEARIILGVEI